MVKEDSSYLRKMKNYRKEALSCSKNVEEVFKNFFDKCIETESVQGKDNYKIRNIVDLSEATMNLALNTFAEDIDNEGLQYIKLIMSELEKIYTEIIKANSHDKNADCSYKISLINHIFKKNRLCPKKVFKSYRNLYLVICLSSEHYDKLLTKCTRLSSPWWPFWDYVEKNKMSEEEKLKLLLDLVNGALKFQPVYEVKAVGYAVKPFNFSEKIITETKTNYDEEFLFPQTDTIFEIEGEGTNQKLVKKPNVKEDLEGRYYIPQDTFF